MPASTLDLARKRAAWARAARESGDRVFFRVNPSMLASECGPLQREERAQRCRPAGRGFALEHFGPAGRSVTTEIPSVARSAKADGAPEGIRTPDLLLRRQPLYPAELRARSGVSEGIRTPDHWNHNPALYQLSYAHHTDESVNERSGLPGGIRTPDPRLRRPPLYPAELQAATWPRSFGIRIRLPGRPPWSGRPDLN